MADTPELTVLREQVIAELKDDAKKSAAALFPGGIPVRTPMTKAQYHEYVRSQLRPDNPEAMQFRAELVERHGPKRALEIAAEALGLPNPSPVKVLDPEDER